MIHNDNLLTEAPVKAEALNVQFSSFFTKEHLDEFPDKGPSPYPTLLDLNITSKGICSLLANLNVHKTAGPDFITVRVLKETQHAYVVAPILRIFFVLLFQQGLFLATGRLPTLSPFTKMGTNKSLLTTDLQLFQLSLESHKGQCWALYCLSFILMTFRSTLNTIRSDYLLTIIMTHYLYKQIFMPWKPGHKTG